MVDSERAVPRHVDARPGDGLAGTAAAQFAGGSA